MPEFWVLNWGSKAQFQTFKTPHMRGSYPSFEGDPHMRGSWKWQYCLLWADGVMVCGGWRWWALNWLFTVIMKIMMMIMIPWWWHNHSPGNSFDHSNQNNLQTLPLSLSQWLQHWKLDFTGKIGDFLCAFSIYFSIARSSCFYQRYWFVNKQLEQFTFNFPKSSHFLRKASNQTETDHPSWNEHYFNETAKNLFVKNLCAAQ